MPSFVITKYTDEVPLLAIDESVDAFYPEYVGHIGADGELLLQYALDWARKNGIQGDIDKAFGDFISYAVKTYVLPDQNSAKLWLREVLPDFQADKWMIPRPHQDGRYWKPEMDNGTREQFKIGTVLLGPGTLFWDVDSLTEEESRKKAHELVSIGKTAKAEELGLPVNDLAVRKWLTEELEKLQVPRVQLKIGECVRWIVGDTEKAAIHSEPDMSDMPHGRIFIAILPGTEEQLRRWAEKCGDTFVVA